MTRQGPRRVLIVQPCVPTYRAPFFARLSKQADLDVELVASSIEPETGLISVPVASARTNYGLRTRTLFCSNFFWQSGALKALMRSQADVVVLFGNIRYLSNLLALLYCKARGIAVVWWTHARGRSKSTALEVLRNSLFGLADAVLLYSDAELDSIRGSGGDLSMRAFALNNGVDIGHIDAVRTDAIDSRLLRDELGIPQDATVFAFIGRLTEKANIALAIHALAECSTIAPVRLLIIGEGPQYELARALARESKIEELVIFVGELRDEPSIARYLGIADAFVYPGNVGLSIIHGAAYGLPAIVHHEINDHMPEIAIFSEGLTGITFRRGSVTSLASSMLEMASDPAKRRSMGEMALQRVRSTFNFASMVDAFISSVECAQQSARRA